MEMYCTYCGGVTEHETPNSITNPNKTWYCVECGSDNQEEED